MGDYLMTTLFEILHVLSDEECFKMLQKVVEHKRLSVIDYPTPKRYYSRILKLKETALIKKVGQRYRPTTLGRVLYDVLEIAEVACCLSWRLIALDEMDENMPQKEKEDIIRILIPDEDIQRLLLSFGAGYPPKYSST